MLVIQCRYMLFMPGLKIVSHLALNVPPSSVASGCYRKEHGKQLVLVENSQSL